MEITGYADRFSVHAGERIRFMVSSQVPRYRAHVVRLIHGDTNPAGPGFKSEAVASTLEGEHEGRHQILRPGSYIHIPRRLALGADGSFSVHLWMQPTTPEKPRQVLLSTGGWCLVLVDGRLTLEHGGQPTVALEQAVKRHVWYRVCVTCDGAAGQVSLRLLPLATTAAELGEAQSAPVGGMRAEPIADDVLIGAEWLRERGVVQPGIAANFYNGKIENPSVFERVLDQYEFDALADSAEPSAIPGLVAAWDFSRQIDTRTVEDISTNAAHGRTVQMPTRAVTGHAWDGRETAWRHVPRQYAAIHFHEDDLDDAGWEVSLEWTVPATQASGVYAVHVETATAEDYIPFYVRPAVGEARARVLFLAPTFSYLAYANEQMFCTPEGKEVLRRMNDGVLGHLVADYPVQAQDKYIVDNQLRSLYDTHVDGSGVCYSSRLRPIVNMRPKYVMPALNLGDGSPHQFNADLHLVDWLHHEGFAYDVATDEDLHREGAALLGRYQVVLTGTHHEYWSGAMLDAMESYLDAGGRLMYLAGNGFYWVTELDEEEGHTVEIRRAGPATRTWDARPGEGHLSTTGEPGGLWRNRGRAPQRLVGVGFTAQGTGPGRPYEQVAAARTGRAAFVFDGIAPDALIGDGPSLVNAYGGAGFELDRVDHALGSPYATIVLATASGFSDAYQHVSEEVLVADSRQGGTANPLVKADMVLVPYPNGGAVFSPASISWCGSLSGDGYENTVAQVTRNVLGRFLRPEPI